MFKPVSPSTFYEHPVGAELYKSITSTPPGPLNILGYYSGNPVESLQHSPDSPEAKARIDKFASWVTGNYNPSTGMHTLYRGIDGPMLEDFNKTNALTSRVVQIFGGGVPKLAEEALKKASKGALMAHVVSHIENAIDVSSSNNISWGYGEDDGILETLELLRGKPSEATSKVLLEKARTLSIARLGGEDAYRLAVKEANNDDVPPETPASIYGLTHSSIHMTSDLEFIKARTASGWFTDVVKLEFVPGSLAAGPNLGIVGNELILPKHGTGGFHVENEWYGVGQLRPKPGQLSIAVM